MGSTALKDTTKHSLHPAGALLPSERRKKRAADPILDRVYFGSRERALKTRQDELEFELRKLMREKPENTAKRKEAERAIKDGTFSQRWNAAKVLGTLAYLESYPVLLCTLKKEEKRKEGATGQEKEKIRALQLEILAALEKTGSDHYGVGGAQEAEALAKGMKLAAFIKNNIADADLAVAAVKALEWTGSRNDILAALKDIRMSKGHESAPQQIKRELSRLHSELEVPN